VEANGSGGDRHDFAAYDAGCGAGDVAFLAREMVGADGHVTGTDLSSEALENARKRAAALGYSNVTFEQTDPCHLSYEQPFDAVVGRFILKYYSNPVAALRRLVRHLRAGGIVVFQEGDDFGARSFPPTSLFDRLFELMAKANQMSGAEPRMGLKLYSVFIAAGLPAPAQRVEVPAIGAEDATIDSWVSVLVQTLRSMMPAIIKHELATAEAVDIETYAQRMSREFRAGRGIWLCPPMIGAWTRKPEGL
jgi:SAM-dependent methyltransferase